MLTKKLFLALFVFTLIGANAQLSGEVYYHTKVNVHKGLPDNERGKRMRQYVPEFMDFDNLLIFSSTESVYKNIELAVEEGTDFDAEENKRHNWMKKRMAPANDIVYTNLEDELVIQKKEFMDKVFLIKDSLNVAKWKMTGEMKEVSGMNCMKAEYIPDVNDSTDTMQMYVWFTPEIAIASGPAGYGGLPGLIVYANINDSQTEISLSKMVMREVTEEEIEEPKKGKVVTQAEFEEIQRKKMEEMKKQYEGHKGGGHRH